METITTLQIRDSGEDYTVYLCKTHKIAEKIIRRWFRGDVENIEDYDISDLENELFEKDIGYWEITEEVVICE